MADSSAAAIASGVVRSSSTASSRTIRTSSRCNTPFGAGSIHSHGSASGRSARNRHTELVATISAAEQQTPAGELEAGHKEREKSESEASASSDSSFLTRLASTIKRKHSTIKSNTSSASVLRVSPSRRSSASRSTASTAEPISSPPPLPPIPLLRFGNSTCPSPLGMDDREVANERKGKGFTRGLFASASTAALNKLTSASSMSPSPLPTPSPSKEKRDPFSRLVKPLFGRNKTSDSVQTLGRSQDGNSQSCEDMAGAGNMIGLSPSGNGQTQRRASDAPSRLRISDSDQDRQTLEVPLPGRGVPYASSASSRSRMTGRRSVTSPTLSAPSLVGSLTAFLTQSALTTLGQLAPASLASSLTVEDDLANFIISLDEQPAAPTTEQLSASSLALPTTSLAGLWRLLRCSDWIAEREADLLAVSAGSNTVSRERRCFDIANMLQHIGDILSATASASHVELVFYHVFTAPQSLDESCSVPGKEETAQGGDIQLQKRPDTSVSVASDTEERVAIGAGADGEGGLQEISVKADEKGLLVALTCLLRQIIAQSPREATVEVGLRLTPLSDSSPDANPAAPGKTPAFWRCSFEIVMTHVAGDEAVEGTTATSRDQPATKVDKSGHSTPNKKYNAGGELPRGMPENLFKYLEMELSGPFTKSLAKKTWKVVGVFARGKPRETTAASSGGGGDGTGKGTMAEASREPTAQELTTFAEKVLKQKKAVLFAAERSLFAKHVTTYLASWGTDISHMPYDRSAWATSPLSELPSPTVAQGLRPKYGAARWDSGFSGSSQIPETPGALLSPGISAMMDSATAAGASASSLHTTGSTKGDEPTSPVSPYDTNTNFVIIDDDVPTLRAQLVALRNSIPQLQLQMNHPNSNKQRPPMTKRSKSTQHVRTLTNHMGTCIIYFTNIAKYQQVCEVVRSILGSIIWVTLPEVLVIPKPVGPRRILTALHTAIKRPVVENAFQPIATSPYSPGVHNYSAMARPSPALSTLNTDFDTAAAAYNSQAAETPHSAAVQGCTPPTPMAGSPSASSPAPLSREALEYFSRAALESGGSSSTGVMLQSPDGRPQAMFFHHAATTEKPSSSRGRYDLRKKPTSRDMARDPATGDLAEQLQEPWSASALISRKPSFPLPAHLEDYGFGLGRRGSVNTADGLSSHAMALERYEAVPPNRESPTSSPKSSRFTNPRKPALLRMPSVQARVPAQRQPLSPQTPIQSIPALPQPVYAADGSQDIAAPDSSSLATGRPAVQSVAVGRPPRRKVSKKPTMPMVPPIKVLIVEDNPINQTILAMFLKRKNVQHEIAKDGQQAIDKWRTGQFHLVLMDIQLPIKSGIEATKEIREMERAANINAFANTPPADATVGEQPAMTPIALLPSSPRNMSVIIVALTASSSDDDRHEALAAGCNDFLTKPVGLDWLNRKLLEWGSMAWLSGFSGPILTSTGARAVGAALGREADRKAKDIAAHLRLRTDRPRSSGTGSQPITPRLVERRGDASPIIAVQSPSAGNTPERTDSYQSTASARGAISESSAGALSSIVGATARLAEGIEASPEQPGRHTLLAVGIGAMTTEAAAHLAIPGEGRSGGAESLATNQVADTEAGEKG